MGLNEIMLRVKCETQGIKLAFLMETLKHARLSTERAMGLVILTAIIKFYTTTKAVFKPLQTLKREQE